MMVKFNEAVEALMLMKNGPSNINVDSSKTKLFKAAIVSKSISARLNDSQMFLLSHCNTLNDKNPPSPRKECPSALSPSQ